MNILRKMMSGRSKGQLFPKEQGAKCSDVDSRTGTHPERGKQGRIRDCSQVQSRAQCSHKPMMMKLIPGHDGSQWSASGLIRAEINTAQ